MGTVGGNLFPKASYQPIHVSPVTSPSRINPHTISKSARSCGTGFIREGVGAVSEAFGACPGLFANEFAPTLAKSARSGGTGFIREGVGAVSETVGAAPTSSQMNSLPRFRNRRNPVGPDSSGKTSVQTTYQRLGFAPKHRISHVAFLDHEECFKAATAAAFPRRHNVRPVSCR